MALKSGVASVAVTLLVTLSMINVFIPSRSPTEGDQRVDVAGPPWPVSVLGIVFDDDGITHVPDCAVTVADQRTGWIKATNSSNYSESLGYFVVDMGYVQPGDVVKITAAIGGRTGMNQTVAPELVYAEGYLWLNVTLSATQTITVTLAKGWSQISMPFANLSYRASSLGLGPGDVISRFNSTTDQYDGTYIVGASPPAMDFAITTSTGYEVFVSSPRSLTLHGVPSAGEVRTCVVPEGGGWVELGFASLKTWTASEVLAMYSGGIAIVCRQDSSAPAFEVFMPGLPLDFVINPGEGFWIWAVESGTFSYQP